MSETKQKDAALSEIATEIETTLAKLEKNFIQLANMKNVRDSELTFMNLIKRPMREIRYKVHQLENQIKIQNERSLKDIQQSLPVSGPSKAGILSELSRNQPEAGNSSELSRNQAINTEIEYENSVWSGSIRRVHCKWTPTKLPNDRGYAYRKSPPFPTENKPEEQWILTFHFNVSETDTTFRFEVTHVEEPENDYEIIAMVILPNFGFTKAFSLRNSISTCPYEISYEWHKLPNYYFHNLVKKETVVHCFLTEFKSGNGGPLTCNVLSTMASILDDSLYTDMVVRTESQDLACHKSVLSAASPVFRAMLENKMKESIENVVDLTGVLDQIAAQDMLNFIYKEAVPDNEERLIQLYNTAKMYDLANYKLIKNGNTIVDQVKDLERDARKSLRYDDDSDDNGDFDYPYDEREDSDFDWEDDFRKYHDEYDCDYNVYDD